MGKAEEGNLQILKFRTAQIDSFKLRPAALFDHGSSFERGQRSSDVIGSATRKPCPFRIYFGFGPRGRPGGMAADESGEKGMNLSAIVSIKAAKML